MPPAPQQPRNSASDSASPPEKRLPVSDRPGKRRSLAFPKSLRLQTPAEFDAVFATRVFAADDQLIMHAAKSTLPFARLGLSISRKVGNAVVRNRWKRLIREAFRQRQHQLPPGIDLVARPQKGASPNLQLLERSIVDLAKRCLKRAERGPRP